ncbi:MAG: hypothetical protein J4A00_06065 [Gammaproteobacteria bacterium]|nr:hypothetical protein [Gammaproteobacteria bacterium]
MTAISQAQFQRGLQFSADQGINLVAVLDFAQLPEQARLAVEAAGGDLATVKRLVLLGHGGRDFWDALCRANRSDPHPVDGYSRQVAETLARGYWGLGDALLLYPGSAPLPLMQLGQIAGWHRPSPLGIGIHPRFGIWSAYRAAFVTGAWLPLRRELPATSPCESCMERPCFGACPVGAVSANALDVAACAEFRLRDDSPCAQRCLARSACPVASGSRYSDEQIRHHYSRSLMTLQRYFGADGPPRGYTHRLL